MIGEYAEQMIVAGVQLQLAALEFSKDDTQTQADARQALISMRDAMNTAQHAFALMSRASAKIREGSRT